MRRRIVGGLVLLGIVVGTGAIVVAHRDEPNPILAVVTLDAPPIDIVVQPGAARAVITTSVSTWTVDTHDGRVLAARTVPSAPGGPLLDPCHDYIQTHWSSLAEASQGNRCARAVLNAAPTDGTTHRAVLIFNTAAVLLDARTGIPVAPPVTVGIYAALAVVDERTHRAFITVSSNGDRAVCTMDTRTGHLVTCAYLGGFPGLPVVDPGANRVFVSNQDDTRTNRVDMLDATTGRILHSLVLGQGLEAYVGDSAGVVHPLAVDARTQHAFVVGQQSAPSGDAVGPGRVMMLDALHGTRIRTIDVAQNPRTVELDARRNRVFVLSIGPVTERTSPTGGYVDVPTGAGTLSVLDASTGRTIRTILVGVNPTTPAVDERTGHILIATIGASIDTVDPDP